MGDLPARWGWVRDLPEGGQGHTFVVRRTDGSDSNLYVLKRLKNPKREAYFEREIQACTTLNHPNVLRVLEQGRTPKGKPFLITEYCAGGSLECGPQFERPIDGLRLFQQIVAGVVHAHTHEPPIYHLDLKPDNILLKDDHPVVADFGICFIEDNEVKLTKEGPRGSLYYCAPELRNPTITGNPQPARADIYSLGKVLYWLFTKAVYDGHEEEYANDPTRRLACLFPSCPQFAFIDELISDTVRRNSSERLEKASDLAYRIQRVMDRIEGGGRVLDLKLPQRCLFCAAGYYRAAHDQIYVMGLPPPGKARFPEIDHRRVQEIASYPEQSKYATMRGVAHALLGVSQTIGMPLLLVCDYCGNVQYFRLDATQDGHGENWLP
jgi:serine/threonine protein kinase